VDQALASGCRDTARASHRRDTTATKEFSVRRILALLCLIPLAMLGTACGGSQAPSQQDLLVKAARSLSAAKSAQIDARARLSVEQQDGTTSGLATIRGGLSPQATSLAGSVKFGTDGADRRIGYGLRVKPKQLFVKIMDGWYSAPLSDLKQQAKDQLSGVAAGSKAKPKSLIAKLRTLMAANDIASHAFTGEITHGPKIDEGETWQWSGTISPEGVIAMVEKYDSKDLEEAKPADREKAKKLLAQLAKVSTITVVVDEGGKPLQLELAIDATKQQIAAIAKAAEEKAGADVKAVHAKICVDLSHYNEPVTVSAPAGAQPIDELLSGLFGR
jgi:hypothetical protein